jgi:hypothetical protein
VGEDAIDDVEGYEKQASHASTFNSNPGGSRVSGGRSGMGGGGTFFLPVLSQVLGVGGAAAPIDTTTKGAEGPGKAGGSAAVVGAELDLVQSPAVADHWDEGLSQAGSMSTKELEKALGNISQGESMSSRELKKPLEELGEEEVDSKEGPFRWHRRFRHRHGGVGVGLGLLMR